MILFGKTICPGIARGPAHVTHAQALLAAALTAPAGGSPAAEAERLRAAIGRAIVELDRIQRQLAGRLSDQDVAIFGSHVELLRDPQIVRRIEGEIRDRGASAEAAVARVVGDLHASFLASRSPLLQDKASDLLSIGRRLVRTLSSAHGENEPAAGAVVVAESLTPGQLVRYAHLGVVAAVIETCSPRSHTAILARGLEIPLVTGIEAVCERIPPDAELIVDAEEGRVICAPTPEEQEICAQVLVRQSEAVSEEEIAPDPPVTLDGVRVRLLLNISDPLEAEAVPQLGADGIGLFRTEFHYMDRSGWPTEDEVYEVYRHVANAIGEAELAIRLVDFGAEKSPPYSDIPLQRNPSLGLRGIRLLLQREDILQPQVRALARLARERRLTVLIPMLDSLDTLHTATERVLRIVGCASREQLPFRWGAMIEVPAAAYLIDEILPHVDSLAVGLNDLTQYLLAADRDDEFVERYHDAMQPAVLRMLHAVVVAGAAHAKPVSICGELAGDARLTGLLLALGMRRLSVSRTSYRAVVRSIRHLETRGMEGIAAELLKLPTAAAVRRFVADRLCEPEPHSGR